MREFIYFSGRARTSGNFDDLMQAGRIDIACHFIINSLFISHHLRQDTKIHLVFYGPPNPPMHLELFPGKAISEPRIPETSKLQNFDGHQGFEKPRIPETGKQAGSNQLDISKKDISGLIKKMLFKHKEGKKFEVWTGYYIEKKSLFKLIDELKKEGKKIYLLDAKGEDIRNIKIEDNPVFILGDNEGFPNKDLKKLKRECIPVSVGNRVYFASQVTTIISNELDRRGI
jgi:tRNA pseudouridine-54 N-methylase